MDFSIFLLKILYQTKKIYATNYHLLMNFLFTFVYTINRS